MQNEWEANERVETPHFENVVAGGGLLYWKLLLNFQFCPHPVCTQSAITKRQTHYDLHKFLVCHFGECARCASTRSSVMCICVLSGHLHYTKTSSTRRGLTENTFCSNTSCRCRRRRRSRRRRHRWQRLRRIERCYFVVVIINLYNSDVFWCSWCDRHRNRHSTDNTQAHQIAPNRTHTHTHIHRNTERM